MRKWFGLFNSKGELYGVAADMRTLVHSPNDPIEPNVYVLTPAELERELFAAWIGGGSTAGSGGKSFIDWLKERLK